MSRWFRLYADAMRNPKVARLSDKEFRLWVRLLAVASENDGAIPVLDDLKHVLSMRLDHLSTGIERLISGGLIDRLEQGYAPHGWAKFQYKSDTSTDRVQRHRAKGNVSETPTETDTDTEADNNPPITRAVEPKSRPDTRLPENWHPDQLIAGSASAEIVGAWQPGRMERELSKFRDHYRAAAGAKGIARDWQAKWRTWIGNADSFGGRNATPQRDRNAGQSVTGYGRTADAFASFAAGE